MLVLHTAADSREAVSMHTICMCKHAHVFAGLRGVQACSQRLLCKRAKGPSMGSSVWNVQCSISGTLKGKTLIDFGDTLACWWHFSTLARIKAGIVGEITVEQGDEWLLLLPCLGPGVLHAARFQGHREVPNTLMTEVMCSRTWGKLRAEWEAVVWNHNSFLVLKW